MVLKYTGTVPVMASHFPKQAMYQFKRDIQPNSMSKINKLVTPFTKSSIKYSSNNTKSS